MGTVGSGGRAIGRGGAAALVLLAALALLPAMAIDGSPPSVPIGPPEPTYASAQAPCGGVPMPEPDEVITGSFDPWLEGMYVMLPFDVPEGIEAVRVKYCHDQPFLASQPVPEANRLTQHTLDMGIYGPRPGPGELWGEDEFRGWGGSSRKDVTLSERGTIDPDPPPVASGQTTVGYRPGPIDPGEWAVELGVAAIGPGIPGIDDQRVSWRVEIELIDDLGSTAAPWEPVPFDPTPANPEPGWYAGDFHVHARHSNPNDATMRETFDYAFAPLGEGAGLDFITLSDYVGDRAWGEIGAFQPDYPGKQIIRSAEVITYRGHLINHASGEFVDYRTGPIFERRPDGSLGLLRSWRPPREIFERIQDAGGWTQIAHPTIFPSEAPTFDNFCRGCPWDFERWETDYSKVDAIEIATGPAGLDVEGVNPGPNPFTLTALDFYESAIDADGRSSNRIAAVGASDSHNAGRRNDPILQAPIGQATTVVYADELSEQGIGDGVRAGHTYVKTWGNDGPDLRFTGRAPGAGAAPAIMGDELPAATARFAAKVKGLHRARAAYPGLYVLVVVRDGLPVLAAPILGSDDDFTFRFSSIGEEARYRLQLHRLAQGVLSVDAVSSPIYHRQPASGEAPAEAASVAVAGEAGTATGEPAGAEPSARPCGRLRDGLLTALRDRLRGCGS